MVFIPTNASVIRQKPHEHVIGLNTDVVTKQKIEIGIL